MAVSALEVGVRGLLSKVAESCGQSPWPRLRWLPPVLLASASSNGLGQSELPGEAPEIDPLAIEEVIVIARKVAESLQEVPVSVVALSGQDLEKANVVDIDDLAMVSPGLTFNESANSRGRGPRIRGVGTTLFGDGVEASVATYVDGVILGRQAMAISDLIDIERVEVLRGPQGTLFGKNASAGVINIITKAPAKEFGADVMLGYGNNDASGAVEYRASASVTGPIIEDQLGFRLTGYWNDRDGFLENVNTGNEFNTKEEYGARGKLLWEPSADLSIQLIADYSRRDQNCCISTALSYGSVRSTNPAFSPVAPGDDNTDVFIDREQAFFQDQKQWGASAEINWSFSESMTLTSISAWRGFEVDDNNEFENNPPGFGNDVLVNDVQQEQRQFTQELRLSYDNADSAVSYVAGFFYFDQALDADTTLLVDLNPGPPVPGGNDITRSVDTRQWALFGQLDYQLTEAVVLLAGLRYTEEELEYDFDRVLAADGFFPFIAPLAFDGDTDDTDLSGMIGAQYFVDNHMAYLTLSRGYKGQGVNVNNFVPGVEVENGLEVVGPEVPTSLELGLKTELLDRRLVVNAAAFMTEYDDYQLTVFDPDVNASGLRNAAQLDVLGVEVEFKANVTESLFFSGAFTWLDATYEDFPNGPCYPLQGIGNGCIDVDNSGTQSAADVQDLSGAPLQIAPDFSYTLSGNYLRPLTGTPFEFFANATWFWRDDVQFNVNQDPLASGDSYGRLNASLGVSMNEGRQRLTLYARNLLDESYQLAVLSGGTNDPGGQNQFLPFDYARVIGLRFDGSF